MAGNFIDASKRREGGGLIRAWRNEAIRKKNKKNESINPGRKNGIVDADVKIGVSIVFFCEKNPKKKNSLFENGNSEVFTLASGGRGEGVTGCVCVPRLHPRPHRRLLPTRCLYTR